jgi:DNA-binding GntR family transcriptional regulator
LFIRRFAEGQYTPGTCLSLREVARDLGVSRSLLHSTIRHLERMGIVESQPGRGTFVKPLDLKDLCDAYDCRAALEGMAARLACGKLSKEQLAELRRDAIELDESIERNRAAGKSGHTLDLSFPIDRRFHETILLAAANARLVDLVRPQHMIEPMFINFGRAVFNQLEDEPRPHVTHEAIVDALDRGEAEKTGRLMEQHVLCSKQLIELVQQQRQSAHVDNDTEAHTEKTDS